MIVVLCTIPHTGTQFFRFLLGEHLPFVGFQTLKREHVERGLIVCHVTDWSLQCMNEMTRRPIVVTTKRNWADVKRSWERRGRKIEELAEYARRHTELVEKWRPIVVSVDEDREARLQHLGATLGLALKTDWSPVNTWEETLEARRQAETGYVN